MIRMRLLVILSMATALCLGGCHDAQDGAGTSDVDTTAVLVMQIQQCSRLYTTEYKVHKIVTYDDALRLKGSFMNHEFNFPLPLGDRKVVIPIDATLKGYIDFEGFSAKNVWRRGNSITIILPDPKVMLTSSKVDQHNIKEYVGLTRAHFSDKELAGYEAEGRTAIIDAIPEMGIVASARESAARLLIPLLSQMGYEEEDITVTFRQDFDPDDLKLLLDQTSIEKKKNE